MSIYNEYLRIIIADYETNQSLLFNRSIEDLTISRSFAEMEGSLNIENVPTIRKRISGTGEKAEPESDNDIIFEIC